MDLPRALSDISPKWLTELLERNEYHAYAVLVPTVELNTPKCFGAAMDGDGRALVVLEDLCLRDVTFLTLQQPIDFELAQRFLAALAKFHGRWWNAPDLKARFDWVPDTSEEALGHYFNLLTTPEHFARYATSPRGAACSITACFKAVQFWRLI